jgi:hypothetical protein
MVELDGTAEVVGPTAWNVMDAVYLNGRGVSFAIVTTGPWGEVASYVEFMGYTQPWYSVRDVGAALVSEAGGKRQTKSRTSAKA